MDPTSAVAPGGGEEWGGRTLLTAACAPILVD